MNNLYGCNSVRQSPRQGPRHGPIRVFLVDDSPLALVLLQRMIATSPDIEVVGTARNGREALNKFEFARPDVICTDYQMPEMDGLALIQAVMASFPRPILVISAVIDPKEQHRTFPLLAAGAVDVLAKPNAGAPFEESAAELVQKIKILSGVVVISRRAPLAIPVERPGSASTSIPAFNAILSGAVVSRPARAEFRSELRPELQSAGARPIRVVTVGASTGGPQVLQAIFRALPASFSCPVLCVQHISAGFLEGLVEWLASSCSMRVKIAVDGEIAAPGTVYFPREASHLEISARGQLICSDAPALEGHKPSVTVTFTSVARAFGASGLGVLLSGMGSDGAAGLEAIERAGGVTFAQNEASCVVFGMPKQAILRGAAQFVMPPAEISSALLRLTKSA